ncbi:MAG: DNA polymerase III subunit beta [Pyrinomonadaceae bacterium]
MKFRIDQGVLKEELGYVQGIVEKKSTIPVLSNILIETVGENTVRFIGTDLDVTIRCEAEAEIIEPGTACIQARRLFDLVRLLPDSMIQFKNDENDWVHVSCGNSNYKLAGISKMHFPEIPEFKAAPLSVSADLFTNFVLHTSFAITNEQSRFTLSGAKFSIKDGKARMVTTDANRLAFIEADVASDAESEMDALIPKKALTELVRISRGSDSDIKFGEDSNHIYFELGSHLLITRKLSGNFPNYEMVMPKDNDKTAILGLDELKKSVMRASLMSDDNTRSIKLTLREGELEISAQSSEEGEGREFIPAEYSGPDLVIGFKSQYLIDFLNNVSSVSMVEDSETETDGDKVMVKSSSEPRVRFELKDEKSQLQATIEGLTEYNYKYVVMPLRV